MHGCDNLWEHLARQSLFSTMNEQVPQTVHTLCIVYVVTQFNSHIVEIGGIHR